MAFGTATARVLFSRDSAGRDSAGIFNLFFAMCERICPGLTHYLAGEAVANHPAGRSEGETGRVPFSSAFWKRNFQDKSGALVGRFGKSHTVWVRRFFSVVDTLYVVHSPIGFGQ